MSSRSQKVRRAVTLPRVGGAKNLRGRPRSEVPDLLLNMATAQFLKMGPQWERIAEQLQRDGFVRVPKNTLIRRVLERRLELDKQNSDPCHY